MSTTNPAKEILYKFPIIGIEYSIKSFNFYANTIILLYGFYQILCILKKSNRNLKDEENYDWSKYNITNDKKINQKKSEAKEKIKQRQKSLSKGTGFIKEEHRFPLKDNANMQITKEKFLNIEEADNLQDMINFAASIKDNKEDIKEIEAKNKDDEINKNYPVESLYSKVMTQDITPNEKLDASIVEVLNDQFTGSFLKIKKIMELYKQVVKNKNKTLTESTYTGLVQLFMSNGYLDHASYFLCQMDRLKMKIPRDLLDLFLDYSVKTKIFENADNDETIKKSAEKKVDYNKFDKSDLQENTDYAYYFSKRNNYKKRKDMKNLVTGLKVENKPFFPKSVNENNFEKIKEKLNGIDPNTIKEFIPKSYKIEKKAEN